jgi:hypothetical protein
MALTVGTTGTYSAGVGHNQPPPQTISERLYESYQALRELVGDIAERANSTPKAIKSQADFDLIGTLIKDANELTKKVEGVRVTEKEPYLKGSREVDSFFKALADRLSRVTSVFQKLADDHQRAIVAEARRKAEEAARLARYEEEKRLMLLAKAEKENRAKHAEQHAAKAEEAAEQARHAELVVNARAADLARQCLDSGIVASSRESWTFEITDYDAISFDQLRQYLKREHVEQAIRQAIKMGHRNLAGVRIFESTKATFR